MTYTQFEEHLELLINAGILEDASQGFSMRIKEQMVYASRRGDLIKTNILEKRIDHTVAPKWFDAHREVYKNRKDIHVMAHSRLPYTMTAAKAGKDVPPLLDDFAQLVGVTGRVVKGSPEQRNFPQKVVKGICRRNAVLIPAWGGLCGAETFDDTVAVAQVLEKGCRAMVDSFFLGGGHKINVLESWLMRLVYRHKYSRMIKAEPPA